MRFKIPRAGTMPSNKKCSLQSQAQHLHLGVYVSCIAFQVCLAHFFHTSNMEQLGIESKKAKSERKGKKEEKMRKKRKKEQRRKNRKSKKGRNKFRVISFLKKHQDEDSIRS